MSDWIIQTENLEKTYGKKVKTHALKGVSLNVPRGSFSCITGPSGHGKSTLLQLIGGLDKPTSGRVLIEGVDISSLSDNRLSEVRGEKIGFVFQFFNLLENLTAAENIQIAMMFASVTEPPTTARLSFWIWSACLTKPAPSPPSFRAGRCSASRLQGRSPTTRRYC